MFTKQELIDAIRESVKTMKVCVPDPDYYARKTDFTTEEISFVDPEALIAALTEEPEQAAEPENQVDWYGIRESVQDQQWSKKELVAVKVISDSLGFEYQTIARDTQLVAELGIDSLDAIELIMAIEDHFDIEIDDEQAESVVTVQDIMNILREKKVL